MILKQQTIIDHQGTIELTIHGNIINMYLDLIIKQMYNYTGRTYNWLVVLTILKNMSQWGWDDIPYMKFRK